MQLGALTAVASLLCVVAIANASTTPTSVADPVVRTACGPMVGTWETDSMASFRGIRYGQSTAGPRRWTPPQPAACWNGTFQATSNGPECVQSPPTPKSLGARPDSEDCLLLNVFSSNINASNDRLLPVVVWIHGGGLYEGSDTSYASIENLVELMNGGVVLVAIQYRLDIFGFLALDELSSVDPRGTSGNYGILDQQLALRWVQDNIKAFGGDAQNVNLIGQSSGGTSIFALLISPASKGLFNTAVSLSGSPNLTISLSDATRQNRQGIVSKTSCADLSGPALLVCLRQADSTELLRASALLRYNPPDYPIVPGGAHWPGIVIVDGHTIPNSLLTSFEKGTFIDVPIIFQSMQAEKGFVANNTVAAWTGQQLREFVEANFNKWNQGPAFGKEAFAFYTNETNQNTEYGYRALAADVAMTCSNLAVAREAANHMSSPVYVSLVSGSPSRPFEVIGGSVQLPFHIWDLITAARLWNIFEAFGSPPYTPTASDTALGDRIRASWYSLFLNGSISTEGWSPVGKDPSSYFHVLIAKDETVSLVDFKQTICDFWQKHGITPSFWWSN